MTRHPIVLLMTIALTILVAPLAATAPPAGRPVTIGYLGNASPALEAHLVDAFREGLRQLGYVEGENLVIRYVWAEGQQERHVDLARELVRLQPDLIFTAGTPGTLAAKHATPSPSSPRSPGTRWRLASWRASPSPAAT
jgi:putative ABC transport system substrate-binding protein